MFLTEKSLFTCAKHKRLVDELKPDLFLTNLQTKDFLYSLEKLDGAYHKETSDICLIGRQILLDSENVNAEFLLIKGK